MSSALLLISFENEVFKSYVFWMSILTVKMLLMAALTAKHRLQKNIYPNPEDAAFHNCKVKFGDPDVERVRRAHRNDLENILPLLIVGYFYVMTDPSAFIATNLFRAAAIARLLHTVVYSIWVMPMPTRGIIFAVPIFITAYMALQTLLMCI